MKICLAAILAVTLVPTFASAEDKPVSGFELSFGFGLVGISGVYVGQKDELYPFPMIAVSRGKWSLSIPKGLQFHALQSATTNLTFALIYDPAPEMPNTALFAGLDRDDGAAFEVEASHDFGVFEIATTIQRDASQRHDGISGDISFGHNAFVGNTFIEGRLGANYLDENHSNFLYGVAADEVNALRGAYDLRASWTPFVEISAIVPINDETSLIGGFRHEQLSKEISRSPLIGTDERTTIGLTIVRSF